MFYESSGVPNSLFTFLGERDEGESEILLVDVIYLFMLCVDSICLATAAEVGHREVVELERV